MLGFGCLRFHWNDSFFSGLGNPELHAGILMASPVFGFRPRLVKKLEDEQNQQHAMMGVLDECPPCSSDFGACHRAG